MKRHANKNIKNFGLSLFVLTLVAAGISVFCQPSWAKTETQEVPVKFTFNSTISVSVSADSITIGSLSPGTAEESSPITVTVATNNANGFYLSATTGQKSTNTDLTGQTAGGKFTHLATDANLSGKEGITDGYWGVAFASGASADLSSSKYNGFPQDGEDNGATGTKLLDPSSPSGEKAVTLKVGAKASSTQPADTYKNQINFYAVAK